MEAENVTPDEVQEAVRKKAHDDALRLTLYLDSLTPEERAAAEEVMRLPGFTYADVYGAVRGHRQDAAVNDRLDRLHQEANARLDRLEKQLACMASKLEEMSTPTWKKAGYGLTGAVLAAGAWWAERGLR